MAELEQKWEYKIFFDQNPSKLQGAKRGPFWPIQVLPMVLGDDPRWSWEVPVKKLWKQNCQAQGQGQGQGQGHSQSQSQSQK